MNLDCVSVINQWSLLFRLCRCYAEGPGALRGLSNYLRQREGEMLASWLESCQVKYKNYFNELPINYVHYLNTAQLNFKIVSSKWGKHYANEQNLTTQ